jgi:pyruvate dehydrogenase E1 component
MVPIVPDESRTFGMEALFRQVGIYSHVGQLYEPVDRESLMYYKEATDGQILEEGITEAGSMSSFIAAGTAHSTHGVNMIPFFIYYSMFGFQRVGDFIWAAGDIRARGFMVGATSGRTTLPGEGLQHQDGNSHVLALSVPNVKAYDPTFAYEVAVIMKEGIRRMFVEQEDLIYYITVMNDTYKMPAMPEGTEEGILKGMYRYIKSEKKKEADVHLLGSGAILNQCINAAGIMEKEFDLAVDVWSVPSWKELYMDATQTERKNMLNMGKKPEKNYIEQCFDGVTAPVVAATDYLKTLPLQVAKWFPGRFTSLGTDGFGRSDNRGALRDYFEVNTKHIIIAALGSLYKEKKIDKKTVDHAIERFKVDPDKMNPVDL